MKNVIRKEINGGMIVFIGIIILAFLIFLRILADYTVKPSMTEYNPVIVWSIIVFAVSIPLFLFYYYSRIIKDLESQLAKAKDEAESERKAKELEEARKLQLSMLPKSFPDIPNLEISADMRTATEVGGDYYDYHLAGDGTITLAVGDATGHGIKAGILVILIKSLFNAMAHTYFIPDFFNHCTKIIKKMNLGFLYMGMTILKIDRYKVTASAAGMPPILIFRRDTNSIEEVVLKGMPLGAFFDFRYQQETFKVSANDVILLLTDGFIELFNSKREMIDYNLVKKTFLRSSAKNSSAIIKDLLNTADNWLNGYPQTDDITFVVIKIK